MRSAGGLLPEREIDNGKLFIVNSKLLWENDH